MITSDRQLATSRKKLDMLLASIDAPGQEGIPDEVIKAGKAQTQELADEISAEIEEYEALLSNQVSDITIHSFEELRLAPIKYRIARRMTVEAFSQEVGVGIRQINRYEAELYQKTNVSTLQKIIEGIGLQVEGSFLRR